MMGLIPAFVAVALGYVVLKLNVVKPSYELI